MSNRRGIFQVAKYFLIALLFPLLNSCKDNTGNFAPTILPKSDLISAFEVDTTTVATSMYLKDSASTSGVLTVMLGSFNDPIFGETKASLYAEVYPDNNSSGFPPWTSNATVDSAVLLIQLYNATDYGSSDPQTFVVYTTDSNIEVIKPSGAGHPYYSDTNFAINPTPIGIQQVTPPNAVAGHDTLRIKLSEAWWKNFSTIIQTNNYWTTNFNQLIKGIYVTTSTPLQLPGQGSLLNVNLTSSFSGIYFYFHNNSTPGVESYASLPIGGSGNNYFVNFNHNYSTTYLGGLHASGKRDSVNGSQLMYVDGLAGVNGRINFPNLYKNWSKLGPIIVNEATLTCPIQPENGIASFDPPSSLYLVGTDTNWAQLAIPSLAIPVNATISNNTYTFLITQYIQSVINGKTIDRGLYIVPASGIIFDNGVVLYGAQHGVSKAEKTVLTIYYTPLKKS